MIGVPVSMLDLATVGPGESFREALAASVTLAQEAERHGYTRVWYAEHHNMATIASSATAVLIAHVAAHTSTIRLGSGGITLPNHSPLIIAEQFGTLASLHPDRIDLGLGRAPGTDQNTMRALRRDATSADTFPQDVQELQGYLSGKSLIPEVNAYPGAGTDVPLYILGSSLFGASLAAALGLPYSFASHFAPDALMDAMEHYRANFKPSQQLERPYFMPAVNVIVADTDEEAAYLFTSMQQSFANLARGARSGLQAPIDDIESYWNPREKMMASHMLTYSFVGGPDKVRKELQAFADKTQPDELMVVTTVYNQKARERSLELLAEINQSMSSER